MNKTKRNKRVAVLMTCYNRVDQTLQCLEHLFKNELPFDVILDVYLVDDSSPDHTGEIIKERYPAVNIIEGTGYLYWTRGTHLAWENAGNGYEYYLWLNDDVLLFDDVIKQLVKNAEVLNDQSIIVGSTCSEEHGTVTYGGWRSHEKIIPNGTLQLCDNFNGNCVLVPSFVYKKIGGLDPLFHHVLGDLDYGLRARKVGAKCYVMGQYVGYCEKHETLSRWCLADIPLIKRVKVLYSPKGHSHPYRFFRYELRHFGVCVAVMHLITIHLRLIFPWWWKK